MAAPSFTHYLYWRVLEARGIRNVQTLGTQDPFVRVRGGTETADTSVSKDGGVTPKWGTDADKGKFRVSPMDGGVDTEKLLFVIQNKGAITDDYICRGELLIPGLLHGQVEEVWVKMEDWGGELLVRCKLHDHMDNPLPPPPPPVETKIEPEELARAVLVTGVPRAHPEHTEKALAEVFFNIGHVEKMIARVSTEGTQTFLIVYATRDLAEAAVGKAGTAILGAPCGVRLCQAKAEEGAKPVDAVADFLASAALAGKSGLTKVKNFGKSSGITDKATAAAKAVKESAATKAVVSGAKKGFGFLSAVAARADATIAAAEKKVIAASKK